MEFDLTQLESEGVRHREAFGLEEFKQAEPGDRFLPDSVTLEYWLRPHRGGARITGALESSVQAECDRCLRPVKLEVSGYFDQRYVWDGVTETIEEQEVTAGELDLERLEGSMLDTRDLAREQIELNGPVRVVCSESCEGLCPECGADLNSGDCKCERAAVDPRWEALKQFKN